jgi:hypothetical protein
VRCSGFDHATKRLVTLDVAGNTFLWDPLVGSSMRVLRNFQLRPECRDECTCLLLDHNMLCVGARDCVTIYDPRRSDQVIRTPLAKLGYSNSSRLDSRPAFPVSTAARSLALKGCLLSVGLSTGGGVIFYDTRKLSTCLSSAGERTTPSRRTFAQAMNACVSSTSSKRVPPVVEMELRRSTMHTGMHLCEALTHCTYQGRSTNMFEFVPRIEGRGIPFAQQSD